MQIKVTINLSNYEKVTIESSEHPNATDCINEVKGSASLFQDPLVKEYMIRVFGGV